jgi:hypothetical protein
MPRFAFGKRKSTAESENDIAAPSFRVLDRSEVAEGNGKSFDGGVRLSAKTHTLPKTTVSDISVEDNIFADFKPKNRYVSFFISFHSTGLCGCPGSTRHSYYLFKFPTRTANLSLRCLNLSPHPVQNLIEMEPGWIRG